MPQAEQNANLTIHGTVQEKLTKLKRKLQKISDELKSLYNIPSFKFLYVDQSTKEQQEQPFKPQWYDTVILQDLILNEIRISQIDIESRQIELDASNIFIARIKEIWVCEKKLRRAQVFYIKIVESISHPLFKLLDTKDLKQFSDKDLQLIIEEYQKLIQDQYTFQKLLNQMNLYLSTIIDLQGQLPFISDLVIQIQKFTLKGNLLQCHCQKLNNNLNQLNEIIALKNKAGLFKDSVKVQTQAPMLLNDSDEEFGNLLTQQTFNGRKENPLNLL